jgi:hypothetical protein
MFSGAIALLVLWIQHGIYARRSAAQREAHERDIEAIKAHNAQALTEHTRAREEAANLREVRRLSLERIWTAISIASTAADVMIKSSAARDIELLVERTAKFIQELAPLLNEVRSATHSVSLKKDDIQTAMDVRNDAVRLFLALDMDSGPDGDYQRRLETFKGAMDANAVKFKTIVEAALTPSG